MNFVNKMEPCKKNSWLNYQENIWQIVEKLQFQKEGKYKRKLFTFMFTPIIFQVLESLLKLLEVMIDKT